MLLVSPIKIKNFAQLDDLAMQTYAFAAVAAGVFILIAAVIALLIKFEGGAYARDPKRRRMWFWALLFGCFATFFLYNMFSVAPTITPNLQSKFMKTNLISSSVALVVYLILGFVLSKMFSTGKLGNWFPAKK